MTTESLHEVLLSNGDRTTCAAGGQDYLPPQEDSMMMPYDALTDQERRMLTHALAWLSISLERELQALNTTLEPCREPTDPDLRGVLTDEARLLLVERCGCAAIQACMRAIHAEEAERLLGATPAV